MNSFLLVIMAHGIQEGWLLDRYRRKSFILLELCTGLKRNSDLQGKPKIIVIQQLIKGIWINPCISLCLLKFLWQFANIFWAIHWNSLAKRKLVGHCNTVNLDLDLYNAQSQLNCPICYSPVSFIPDGSINEPIRIQEILQDIYIVAVSYMESGQVVFFLSHLNGSKYDLSWTNNFLLCQK